MNVRKRPALLAQASAYFRLAAKADRAGNHAQGARYRKIADGKVAQHRRNTDALKARTR
jgi:hypothetical protein